MLKIISINLNGIRSAARKGFFDWLAAQNADVICMQELRAQQADMQDALFQPAGYTGHFHFAEKKGYSGVGIYTRHQPKEVTIGLGWDMADQEGRYVAVNLGRVWVASLYMPSGTSGDLRQAAKFDFLERYNTALKDIRDNQSNFIICGDWNIAHRQIDLKNWRSNQTNSGFLPEERTWMDNLFDNLGFVDAFRTINQEPEQYTWWSNRGQAWAKNVGWRIDYQVVTPSLKTLIKSATIYKDQRFSDHAPLTIEYDLTL